MRRIYPAGTNLSLITICTLFVLIVGSLAYVFWDFESKRSISFMDGLTECANSTDGDSSLLACTQQLVHTQLKTRSTKELMRTITSNKVPKKYLDCHSISHVIGAETYKKSKDVESALEHCTPGCFDGCMHGVLGEAVEEKFGTNDKAAEIAHMDISQIRGVGMTYCAHNAGICHGMGHIVYSLLNDFNKASDECSLISTGLQLDACISGVFMQGVGGIGTSLVMGDSVPNQITLPPNDLAYPCDTLAEKYQHGCFAYLPLYEDIAFTKKDVTDPNERLKQGRRTCENMEDPSRSYCFEGMGRLITYFSPELANVKALADFCAGLSVASDQKSCLLGREYIFLGYQNAKDAFNICASLDSKSLKDFCFNAIFSSTASSTTSAETACRYAIFKDLCFESFGAFQKTGSKLPDYRFGLFGRLE